MSKIYTIKKTRVNLISDSYEITFTGTLPELLDKFSYTLECGASWSHEKGNKKINRNLRPSSHWSLI